MADVWPALLGLCSCMALFLYSVKITSGSLQAIAGEKLKSVLAKLTGNRIMGVLVGAGITALIQSSTATSVMSVGFVNAGLMNLYQALWVIMGANIGTNITAQLIAFDVGAIAQRSIEAVLENSEKTQQQINDTEEYVNYLNKEISYYISHAIVFDMSEKHALAMSALFKITGNIERMGDHATNIAGYANLLESKGLKLSDKARAEVSQMVKTTSEAYNILLGSKPGSVHIKMAQMEQKIAAA